MGIPEYPAFRPLALEDKPVFDEALRNAPPEISELTFTNLFAWRTAYAFEVSRLGQWIIVRAHAPSGVYFLDPIGSGDKREAIARVLDETKAMFRRVPESTKARCGTDPRIAVSPDRNNADYLYLTADLISLRGKKYDGKRNLIKRFKSSYPFEYVRLTHRDIKECLDFQEQWCVMKDCDSVEGLRNERAAVHEMVHHCELFRLIAGAVKVEGTMRAVAIAEPLNPSTMVMHILKADPNIPGLYQTVMNEFLSREAAAFTYVNLEQDLGVEGLRKAKESYQPHAMVNKYTLFLR